jgi:NodT family efflux transporter outer membrane factor (OMF) lipoprotein
MNGKLIVLGVALGAIGGCEVGPNYKAPKMAVPQVFGAAATQPSATQPATQPVEAVDIGRWWESFHDPALNQLIARGVKSSLDVRLAEARVREARAQLEGNVASLFPTVDSAASYARSRTSKNAISIGGSTGPGSSTGTGGTTTGGTGTGGTGGTNGGGTTSSGTTTSSPFAFALGTTNLYQAGFDAGWEIDVFGGTRRAIEAAQYTLEAQVDARRNATITLLSEAARNYIILRGLQQELAIVRDNVASQNDFLDLTKAKFQAGIATDLDVARQQAQVATTESEMPTLETEIQQAIHRLGVLLDRNPTDLEAELTPIGPLPGGPPEVPAGLPSELLRRRPDVLQAERQLAASNANIGVATADLFPKFNLTGSFGFESLQLKSWFNSPSQFWSFGPSVQWRIFDAGQIFANIRVQNARQQEAVIQYRQAVLQSLSDVEDALTAYHKEQTRREALQRSVEANERSVSLAKQLNQAGLVDFLNVLTAEQSLFLSQDQLAQSNQTVSTNLVALYKALGGGWEITEQAMPQQSASAQ